MKKKTIKFYKKYCTGCGLCSITGCTINKNSKSHTVVDSIPQDAEFLHFAEHVCPASGVQTSSYSTESIWGAAHNVYLGWSQDEEIRYNASSGGVITSICCYLIDHHLVDGIIQIRASKASQIETEISISVSREEILSCMGSRYTVSSPLLNIGDILSQNGTYALVGKPCDITALRNYSKLDSRVNERIKYMLSFFCAGTPSLQANAKLLIALNTNATDCTELTYRGHGWPGKACAKSKNGTNSMSYEQSWGQILGRDVRPICRLCLDGIGEQADISCGDAWHLDCNKKPSFVESAGRNVVFTRTEIGEELLLNAFRDNYLEISNYPDYVNELQFIQKYQFERRVYMVPMCLAHRLFLRTVPNYSKELLQYYSSFGSFAQKLKRFLGIIKRIIRGII